MKSLFCQNCDKVQDIRIVTKEENYEVRGEKFSIEARVCICKTCNEEIFDEELDGENLDFLYSKYRKKHNLLTPKEIKDIRNKYGLSQRAMSRLFEWGEVTLTRYENGSIQDSVHNEVLELIEKPENMFEIFEKNKILLTEKERNKLNNRLNKLISEKHSSKELILFLEDFLTSDNSVNEYSGFRPFDLQKVKNIILYIAEAYDGVMKTKLNKLLFYIDFLFFKTYSVSITGSKYARLQFGPIPNDYDDIINLMIREGLLEKNERIFNKARGVIGEELKSKESINKKVFNDDELEIIDFCLKKFKKLNCGQISKYSHKEKPFKKTQEKKLISYSLAPELSLNLD